MKKCRLWKRIPVKYTEPALQLEKELELILSKEVDNTDRIHLFYSDYAHCWAAFQQSALNLIEVVPRLACNAIDELFVDREIKLTCVRVNSDHVKRYNLLIYCIQVSDSYIELQKKPVGNK